MAEIVALSEIEQIVGVERWHDEHVGLAGWAGELRVPTFFILHSHECLRRLGHANLNECLFSEALDDMNAERQSPVWMTWSNHQNVPTLLEVEAYGRNEGKGTPWYRLVPTLRLPRVYVPPADSLVRKYRD